MKGMYNLIKENNWDKKLDINSLFDKAAKARSNAYCPYSKFHVGAAVVGEDGTVYTGCNVENASYGLTICAERNAIFNAVGHGCRKIKCVVIALDDPGIGPCGACRAVIDEFADGDIPVVFGSTKESLIHKTSKELYVNRF